MSDLNFYKFPIQSYVTITNDGFDATGEVKYVGSNSINTKASFKTFEKAYYMLKSTQAKDKRKILHVIYIDPALFLQIDSRKINYQISDIYIVSIILSITLYFDFFYSKYEYNSTLEFNNNISFINCIIERMHITGSPKAATLTNCKLTVCTLNGTELNNNYLIDNCEFNIPKDFNLPHFCKISNSFNDNLPNINNNCDTNAKIKLD